MEIETVPRKAGRLVALTYTRLGWGGRPLQGQRERLPCALGEAVAGRVQGEMRAYSGVRGVKVSGREM